MTVCVGIVRNSKGITKGQKWGQKSPNIYGKSIVKGLPQSSWEWIHLESTLKWDIDLYGVLQPLALEFRPDLQSNDMFLLYCNKQDVKCWYNSSIKSFTYFKTDIVSSLLVKGFGSTPSPLVEIGVDQNYPWPVKMTLCRLVYYGESQLS